MGRKNDLFAGSHEAVQRATKKIARLSVSKPQTRLRIFSYELMIYLVEGILKKNLRYTIMIAANYSEFRTELKKYLDSVEDDNGTLIIKRKSGGGTVLISLDE